jgi:copper homeostasis protein
LSGFFYAVVFSSSRSSLSSVLDTAKLLEKGKKHNLEVTFHRAFDFTLDPIQSLEQIIQIGFDRLLTSALKPTAIEGVETLQELVKKAQSRIEIMAGSGVNASNAKALANTGVNALHFTARKSIAKNDKLNMGNDYEVDHSKIQNILKEVC